MNNSQNILTDRFGRKHNYLRISLTERCNLRCSYCMPLEGVPLLPKNNLMNAEEIYAIAKLFVDEGVDKIRFTGGEPLLRKDFPEIIERLSVLPIKMSMTTNGITIDRHISLLKKYNLKTVNLSLDTLDAEKFKDITFRDYFQRVYDNILLLLNEDFQVKINVVLMKNVNDNEIIDFIKFTQNHNVIVRFIEFMPFDGNQWDREKTVSYDEIMNLVHQNFTAENIVRLQDEAHDTTRNFKINGFKGSFGIISTVTNPFCDTCNRIRLTANGQLKNCLFSATESDLLTPFRNHEDIKPLIKKAVLGKFAMRGGLSDEEFINPLEHVENRSMIRIGG
ncbi:GTP 3',8-cyclase MoaA [Chryseobacterium terrae]|uniref:GTP 3',8-cyclase n=1 Tax=Chryseobacterium terrae TaxID=3163299 RepID=A0ABW8Y0C7_9FLAO